MRIISYSTNRLLMALTDSAPYNEFGESAKPKRMSEAEIHSISDLLQPALGMDMQVEVADSCVTVTERPYLTDQVLDLEVERIKLTMVEDVVTGRHSAAKALPMKLTRMPVEMENVTLHYTDLA